MKTIILLSLLTFAVTAQVNGSATVSKVISVYDGDTFRASIKNYPPIVGET
jgi:micrococcal nuclease